MSAYQSRATGGWKNTPSRRPKGGRRRKIKLPENLGKNLVLLAVALFAAGTLFVLGLFAFVSRDLPDPNSLTERRISQTTKIYDRTGEHLLYEIFGAENRTLVKVQEGFCHDDDELETDENGIPLIALQATIAAEDRKFCEHRGVSIKGLARAVFFQGRRGGGSTLTQQLVKNAILSPERTIIRKAKELIISLELERRYSKDEILQIYFNEIPYGSTFYGIEAASQNYYGKPSKDLTLAEAATLAGLPQIPTFYLNNPDRLRIRRDWILGEMADIGFITEEEAEAAKQEDTDPDVQITNIDAPHFVFHVKEQLEEEYGQREVEEGGLKVITTLDWEKQQAAEEAVRNHVEEAGEQWGFTNAALVAIDPRTGEVVSMVGSKDFFDDEIDGKVNVTTRLRQPGSSMKPIVYAKAFDSGYTPNTVLWDVKTNFPTPTGNYAPNNYDLSERGPMRLREALQGSLNISAVKILYMVGIQNVLDFARDLGYTSFEDRSRFGLAVVLGGGEVQLLEHVAAYGVFANEGVRNETVTILKVEDANGEVLQEWEKEEGKEVFDKNSARTITNVLSDDGARAYVFGTGSRLTLPGRPVAAKTGTTNDYHDGWTVGYTPQLAAGVWAGNNDNSAMKRGSGGSVAAAPIWNAFMRAALADEPVLGFTSPSIPQTGKPVLDGSIASQTVVIDKASGKLATEYTPESQREEVLFAEYHSILHYVDRADPTGPAPNPPRDPYYESWEAAIAAWIEAKEEETGIKITQAEPPTEEDDVHTPENAPRVRFQNPRDGEELENRRIDIDVTASAPRGVERVEFYIDGFFLGSDNRAPFGLDTTIPSTISRGYHTIKAIAYDDVENSTAETRGVRILQDATSANVEIIDPKNGQTIERNSDEFNVVVSIQNPSNYRTVFLYAQPIGPGDKFAVGAVSNPESPFITMTWELPPSGSWALSARAIEKDGDVAETPGSVVKVVPVGETPAEESEDSEEDEEEEAEPFDIDQLNPFANPPPGAVQTSDEPEEEPTEEEPTESET